MRLLTSLRGCPYRIPQRFVPKAGRVLFHVFRQVGKNVVHEERVAVGVISHEQDVRIGQAFDDIGKFVFAIERGIVQAVSGFAEKAYP